MKETKKNVLITGTCSGIGKAVAELFIKNGHRVFGVDLKPTTELDIDYYSCDITDTCALSGIREAIGKSGIELDVIIAAAGIHDMLSLAEGDEGRIKRLIDVNLYGTAMTVREFHPLLAKRGRVVIITSEVATYAPLPFNGLYSVTKCALEAYAHALRGEISLNGQSVVTVRPGAVATPLSASSRDTTAALAKETKLYSRQAYRFSDLVNRFTGTPIPPERLAPTVYRAATKRHPSIAYAKHRNLGLVLLSLLPKRVQIAVLRLLLNRKEK
jgi:NAD(P)-dependent dehydrogenase (short-subunit alcohol dehydrogenase family)